MQELNNFVNAIDIETKKMLQELNETGHYNNKYDLHIKCNNAEITVELNAAVYHWLTQISQL